MQKIMNFYHAHKTTVITVVVGLIVAVIGYFAFFKKK